MRIGRRMRLRTMLAIVAIVTFLTWIPIAWQAYSRIDQLTKWGAASRRFIVYHDRELAYCIVHEKDIPYPESRWWGEGYYAGAADWAHEIDYHRGMLILKQARSIELADELRKLRRKWFFLP